MVYFRSRMVCDPPPSDHSPFLEALAWSSKSHSLARSGLKHTEVHPVNINFQTKAQEFKEPRKKQDLR